ncbi:UDP-glucose 4-epimerase GalE [Thermodesulfobacteriota bacterium]
MKILVTGGAGYIGSHTIIELLNADHEVIAVDNLSNSKEESLNRVQQITGKDVLFFKVDIQDNRSLCDIFRDNPVDAVIHFAGLKAVGESVVKPLEYYRNNVNGTLSLIEAMRDNNIKKIVFSSSCTVYGDPRKVPITEDFPLSATNPYGRSKLIIEEMLRDTYRSDESWDIILLRYFNPVGAHPSGMIGEDPNGIPNNLLPYISQVAVGKLECIPVFGDDYPTKDGTGIRDYIHVVDLAIGHLKALDKIKTKTGVAAYNLGTGMGYSVLEMIEAFKEASGKDIPYQITDRRPGDIAVTYADPTLAQNELNWTAEKGINEMCADTWNWQSRNPNGY